jgi:hypothetical protein
LRRRRESGSLARSHWRSRLNRFDRHTMPAWENAPESLSRTQLVESTDTL